MTATADGVIVVLVLIESDWNLKYKDTASAFPTGKSINRIRLEFKGIRDRYAAGVVPVLIESDWNLKICTSVFMFLSYPVLIESDWNLKEASIRAIARTAQRVLIESDWNLKDISPDSSPRLHGVLIESYWNLKHTWPGWMNN